MKRFDDIIKDKIEQFEYPYEEFAWKQFTKKLKIKSIVRTSIISTTITGIALIIYFYFNNTNNSEQHKIVNQNSQINDTIIIENQNNSSVEVNKNPITFNKNIKSTKATNNETKESYNQENTIIYNKQPLFLSSDDKTNKFSVSVNTNQGCVPLTILLYSNNIPDNANFYWDFGDGNFSREKNPTHTYKKAGKYSVSLIIKINEQEITETTTINVLPRPIARFSYQQVQNTITLNNQSKQFGSIKWKLVDTLINEESWSFSINKSGNYKVQLIAENQYGCTDTMTKFLDLTYFIPVQLAEAFTPDGDGINDLFGPQVLNYSEYTFNMQIFQKTGRCVFEGKGSPVWWDGTDYLTKQQCPSDVYFYKIIAVDNIGNKQEFSGKIHLIR